MGTVEGVKRGVLAGGTALAISGANFQAGATVTIEATGRIDASNRGYGNGVSYPGVGVQGNGSGGSHLGVGGLYYSPGGVTYGSVYRPQEAGAGGRHDSTTDRWTWGGGVVRMVVNGSCEQDWPAVLELARAYPEALPDQRRESGNLYAIPGQDHGLQPAGRTGRARRYLRLSRIPCAAIL